MLSKAAPWDSGRDEAVEVDQRGLIEKILARYPGQFTVFRELLQNSDDAKSSGVEIRFETKDYLDAENVASSEQGLDLENTTIHQWTFKNNGDKFREEDWKRLKKIGEGNPDEEKIGAFGVGFYSLFSVTEEPRVTSGDKWMMFHWKDGKNQLFARSGSNGRSDQSQLQWTTFTMPLQEPCPMPSVFDLAQFLASSITFMKHLSEINIYCNDRNLAMVKKTIEKPNSVISKGYIPHSPQKMMEVTSIDVATVKIQANVMDSVNSSHSKGNPQPVESPSKSSKLNLPSFLRLERRGGPSRITKTPPKDSPPAMGIGEADMSLSRFSATVKVKLEKKMTDELERSTKKKPPSKLKFELIYTSRNQYDASLNKEGNVVGARSIFQGLRADLNKNGDAKVFIGHSTSQSTGIGGHISARLFPTVERECIDFMNPHVATWNREMLHVGGILARAAYDHEFKQLQQRWDADLPATQHHGDERRSRFVHDALHALKFFNFYDSQPSREVSAQLCNAFFSCSESKNLRMISSTGVKVSGDIRLPDPHLTDILRDVPMLPVKVSEANLFIIKRLKEEGIFREITFQDVIPELRSRALTDVECVACFKWWISAQFSRDKLPQFLKAVRIAISDREYLPLNSVRYFFDRRSPIPVDGPLPRSLLPLSISEHFSPEDISAHFALAEFNVQDWLLHICDIDHETYNIRLSATSERVINAVSSGWDRLSEESKSKIKDVLHDKACIPTRKGMNKPSEAYFPSADVLPDLPIISFSSNVPNQEAFLEYLGVRKHVDLQVILDRMGTADEWPATELVKYLACAEGITPEEIMRLRDIAAFPKEMSPGEAPTNRTKYIARQLYPPVEEFRMMGLPILDWGRQKWWHETDEATFLYKIGLQRHPPIQQLNELCGSGEEKARVTSFNYLLEHLDKEYHLDDISAQLGSIIPAFDDSGYHLARVDEVCSNEEWATMGLLVLQREYKPYADKLKIRELPTSETLVSMLQDKRPQTRSEAVRWFSLLSTALKAFSEADFKHLSKTFFIPITEDEASPPHEWQSPSRCFLDGNAERTFYKRVFTYVDFGAQATAFLSACGSKNQPSVDDIATKLLENPQHFYKMSDSPSNYLDELRKLALNGKNLTPDTLQKMKDSPILLGVKKNPGNVSSSSDEEEVIYTLAKPQEIAIVDDINTYHAFSGVAVVAPQEDMLEGFYHSLGCRKLSTHIKENWRGKDIMANSAVGRGIRALILERLPLFLNEHKHKTMKDTLSGDKFSVVTYNALQVRKHLTLGGVDAQKEHAVSALGFKDSTSGDIVLWVTPDAKDSMFEVAASLNRLLFEFPKTNDALLFMTILQSDLNLLKRLGYNVDRILGPQKRHDETSLRPFPGSDLLSRQAEKGFGMEGWQPQWAGPDWESRFSNDILPAIYGFNLEAISLLESYGDSRNLGIDGYCDFSGGDDALHCICTLDSVQIFLSDKSPHKKEGEFISIKRDKIKRFIDLIIHPLERIFGLPSATLRIFYDDERPLTAINREKGIYLNLRYFEEWHSHGLSKENLKEARFMWYFTIAHVLTHNVVRPHGAQHDRVFSSLCGVFMSRLMELVGYVDMSTCETYT